ncbi:hypothetical protein BDN70DRAFT_836032 [Pholiota conissans]|uniref:Transmembrane protein n=1 Tax=Pholiota conissans TaxID=109636 RepID=A0A9P5Z2C6_9AGAR|nr:hypothetical protein BDN70DRAFT_836032 [Pholiota conissans]
MSSPPRLVVVDDTDPDIQYSGPWFADSSGSQDKSGNFGPAYQSTLHGTTLNASLSYSFTGTQVKVWGSNNLRNDSGVLDPTWECFIDHISIGATTPFQFAENNWVFCEQDTLVDGSHVLTVNATVKKAQTFWFDQIQYAPSASVPLDNKTILIDSLDPQVLSAYGSGWGSLGGTANQTTTTNSLFTFNFTGVSLSWYGFIPTEYPHAATTATYSVDGKTPVGFLLNGLPASSGTVYNQKFFQTEKLAQGNHQIVVLFQGNGQTTPLTLDYLMVQNGTAGSNSTTAPSDDGTQQHHKSNAGFIALGVVLGVVLILLAIAGFWYIRRRHRRQELNEKGVSPSSPLAPQPFVYTPVSPVPMETSILDGYSGKTNPNHHHYASASTRTAGYGHSQMPSISATDASASQSIDPPSSGPASTAFASNVNTTGHETVPSQTFYAVNGGGNAQSGARDVGTRAAPSSVASSSTRNEKERREAEATAAALRPQRRNDGGLPSPPTSLDGGTISSSGFVMHQDSGIRLPANVAGGHIEEIPPEYTAG